MKQYMIVVLILGSMCLQIGCTNRGIFPAKDLTQENWQCSLPTNPNQWLTTADRWFSCGLPSYTEVINKHAPPAAGVHPIKMQVSNFTNIAVNGGFQVQIFGTDERNTVFAYGPQMGLREVGVDVRNDTLYVFQKKEMPLEEMQKVIVRIGAKQINHLLQKGCGKIETFNIFSRLLTVTTMESAAGDIYIGGNTNLRRVSHAGSGTVNILQTRTPTLDIITSGSGALNISGKVGVQFIRHVGTGDINILGANTNQLVIEAAGTGRITVWGLVDLKEVRAKDQAKVNVNVNSCQLHVLAYDKAEVGLAGRTRELRVETFDSAQFLGRQLQTQNAFVRAADSSHINVAANYELFASAADNGSVYYFGPARLAAKFETDNGTIIPIGFDPRLKLCNNCVRTYAPLIPYMGMG